MIEKLKPCVACDCVDDDQYYSLNGAGPFCADCWQSLTDADQSLLLEKRLEQAEDKIEQLSRDNAFYGSNDYVHSLKILLTRAADALSKGPFHPQYKLDLADELRKAAE